MANLVNSRSAPLAFLSPLPLAASAPSVARNDHLCALRPVRPTCPRAPFTTTTSAVHPSFSSDHTLNDSTSASASSPNSRPASNRWNAVSRAIKLSTLVLVSIFVTPNTPQQRIHSFSSSAAHAAPPTATKEESSSTSDVEAAALTLGAVTLGGLFMRVVTNRARNEEVEKQRLAEECDRLQQEEVDRTKRLKRSQLESFDTPDGAASEQSNATVGGESSDDIMAELRKRVESIEKQEDVEGATAATAEAEDKTNDLRHSPIPDRGTGSAVLERPDETAGVQDTGDQVAHDEKKKKDEQDDSLAKPDQLEMLNRMWNLSPPDKGKE